MTTLTFFVSAGLFDTQYKCEILITDVYAHDRVIVCVRMELYFMSLLF